MKLKNPCYKEVNKGDPCLVKLYEKGYFSNDKENWEYSTLLGVDAFKSGFRAMDEKWYSFFIPEFDAVPLEKQFRPFKSVSELPPEISVGAQITIKSNDYKANVVVTAIEYKDLSKLEFIHLGTFVLAPRTLFENYKYMNSNGDWVPFGVEAK